MHLPCVRTVVTTVTAAVLAVGVVGATTATAPAAGAVAAPAAGAVPTASGGVGDARPGTVLDVGVAGSAPEYPSGTRARSVRYLSTDGRGKLVPVTGLVLLPPGRAPRGGWPVVSWAHGTTGIGDDCAPSAVPGAYYGTTLGAFLRAGLAVAATDYAGLGTPGVHPYLMADSEARATVDVVRAARRIAPELSRTWVAAGHSQGGQAAWAVGELPPRYLAGLDYRGAVAFAPAPNFSPLVDDLASSDPLEQQFVSMLLVGLHTQRPGLPLADYLGPDALALLPEVRTVCFDDLTRLFVSRQLPAAQFQPRDAQARTTLRHLLRRHEIAHTRNARPLLVLQGLADQVVPPASTRAEVAEARDRGSDVILRTYPRADHGGVLDAGMATALAWIDRITK